MLWITLTVALLISLVALLYVVWPIIQPNEEPVWVEDDRLTEMISRKDAVLRSIKDLEFDYQVGKVSDEDYERFNQRLRRQAITYIQQIEKLAPQTANLDETLEAEIAQMRRTLDRTDGAVLATPAAEPAEIETPATDDAVALAGTQIEKRFCTNCGQPVAAAHKFCAHCGARQVAEESVSVQS